MSNLPTLPNLDFGDIDITPPSLKRQSQPYIKHSRNATLHETESMTQLPSSFSDSSSLLDSTSPKPNVSIKSIPSHSYVRIHDIRYFPMDYYIHWKWEFFASLFILACPITIVITLYPYAEQPLPQWPFQISINTLLSIYSLVFKTCLSFVVASCIGQLQWSWFSSHRPLYDLVRYDKATRGPWGSVQLLCSKHIRHPLTGLGTVILIASVAIDPFIQQLVSPYDCSIPLLNLNATLPRTNLLSPNHSMADTTTKLFPVRFADYTPSNFIDWQCSTGNCTFSQMYGTLAYCSSCEDCSDKLFLETKCYDNETDTNATSATGYCADNLISFATTSLYVGGDLTWGNSWINATFASSNALSSSMAISSYRNNEKQFVPGENAYILVPRTVDPIKRVDPDVDPRTGKPWTDCNTTVELGTWRCQGYGAAVCSLQPCVRKYNATINGVQLNEHMISSSGTSHWGVVSPITDDLGWMRFRDDSWIGMIDTHCISEDETETLEKQGYKIDSSSQWLAFNRSIILSQVEGNLVSSLLLHNCLYLMEYDFQPDGSFPYWKEVLGDSFWGVVENQNSGIANGVVSLGGLTGPSMMMDLYNNGHIDFEDVQETFSNISDIMTAWIRTHGDSKSDPAVGEVLHYATCLHVWWPWLAFTVTLALLSLAFFIATVVVTDRQQLPVWKSSPLALMIGGPNAEISSESTLDAIEKKSKKLLVTLIKGSKPHVQLMGKDNELVELTDGRVRCSMSTPRNNLSE